MKWTAVVQETVTRCRQYTVEADTQHEATLAMEAGNTTEEHDLADNGEVIDRTMVGGIRKVDQ